VVSLHRRTFAALRRHNFRLFWFSQLVSLTGTLDAHGRAGLADPGVDRAKDAPDNAGKRNLSYSSLVSEKILHAHHKTCASQENLYDKFFPRPLLIHQAVGNEFTRSRAVVFFSENCPSTQSIVRYIKGDIIYPDFGHFRKFTILSAKLYFQVSSFPGWT